MNSLQQNDLGLTGLELLLNSAKQSCLQSLQLNDQAQLSPRIQRPLDRFNSAFKAQWLRSLVALAAVRTLPRLSRQSPIGVLCEDVLRDLAAMLGWADRFLNTRHVLESLTEVIHDFEAMVPHAAGLGRSWRPDDDGMKALSIEQDAGHRTEKRARLLPSTSGVRIAGEGEEGETGESLPRSDHELPSHPQEQH